MIDSASSGAAEYAARVSIVHHHDAAVLVGEIAQLRQRTEVAVHAEYTIRDEQPSLVTGKACNDLARRDDVAMRKDLDRGTAQTRAIDDACMIQLVGHDHVVAAQERRHGSGVRGETALKDDGRLGVLEDREPPLELHVDSHRAGDRAYRSRADAERLQCFEGARSKAGMRRQPQIVVRREIDDLPMINGCAGRLLTVEYAQAAIKPLTPQIVECPVEVGEWVGTHVAPF